MKVISNPAHDAPMDFLRSVYKLAEQLAALPYMPCEQPHITAARQLVSLPRGGQDLAARRHLERRFVKALLAGVARGDSALSSQARHAPSLGGIAE